MWRFKPILKPTIWGGSRIAAFKGEAESSAADAHIGETYELSGMPGHESVVAAGPDKGLSLTGLIERYGVALLGRKNLERTGLEFPLLVKFLDASSDLSVQVHPDDKAAPAFGLPNGKNELWYMLEATPKARLCAGFNTPLTRDQFKSIVSSGRITDYLHFTPVTRGEVYYIPGGTVHSLGEGCLVLEIQQPSDTTFRIYDYNRVDSQGRPRELHTAQALESLDLSRCGEGSQVLYPDEMNINSGLLATNRFTVNRMHISYRLHRDYRDVESFKVLVVVSGHIEISDSCGTEKAGPGTLLLVGADERDVTLKPTDGEAIVIETYI
jgi:mannose-6-phosphate isomerase